MNDDIQKALDLAGKMADYSITLIGGHGLNGEIPPIHPDHFSDIAKKLRTAAEDYNRQIISMAMEKNSNN